MKAERTPRGCPVPSFAGLRRQPRSRELVSESMPLRKDSLRLIPQPLASFPKAFGLDSGAKGDFPHLFNTIDNMDLPVDMPMPDISYWEPHMKSPEARKELEKWYKERSAEGPWDNYKELETYCKQDVRILAQGLVAFRQGVIDVTGFDPPYPSTERVG